MKNGPGHSMVNNSTGQRALSVFSQDPFSKVTESRTWQQQNQPPKQEILGTSPSFTTDWIPVSRRICSVKSNPKLTMLNTQVPLTCSSEPPKTEQSQQGPVPAWTRLEQDLLFRENLRTDNIKVKYLQTLEFGNPADPPEGRRWNRRLSGRSFPALKIKEKIK